MTISEDELVSAAENPGLVEAAAQAVMRDDLPEFVAPEDGPVDLPGGFVRVLDLANTEEVTDAWVCELNGVAEERIAKAISKGKSSAVMDAILEGGVEKLGQRKPTAKELKDLLSGDREFLFLAISAATYGEKLDYEDFSCQKCGEKFSFSFEKMDDIPIRRLDSLSESNFTVKLRKGGEARVRLATGADTDAAEAANTNSEAISILLSRCVEEITWPDGSTVDVSDNKDVVRTKLGMADREAIQREMAKRSPGPLLDKVVVNHPDCSGDGENVVVVGPADLFRWM